MKTEEFDIGANLRRLRLKRGLSQNEVSKILDIPQARISQYETQGVMPPTITFIRLCALYDVKDVVEEFKLESGSGFRANMFELEKIKKMRKLNEENTYIIDSLIDKLLESQEYRIEFDLSEESDE